MKLKIFILIIILVPGIPLQAQTKTTNTPNAEKTNQADDDKPLSFLTVAPLFSYLMPAFGLPVSILLSTEYLIMEAYTPNTQKTINKAYPHSEVFEVPLDWERYYKELQDYNVYRVVDMYFYTFYKDVYINNKKQSVEVDGCNVIYEDPTREYRIEYEAKDVKGLQIGDVVSLSDKDNGNKIIKKHNLYLLETKIIPYEKSIDITNLPPDTVGRSNKYLDSVYIKWRDIDFARQRQDGVQGPIRWIQGVSFVTNRKSNELNTPYFSMSFYDERGIYRSRQYPRISISAERIKAKDIVETRWSPEGIPVFVKLPDYLKK